MDLIVATIAISFVPLLEKICSVLGITRPNYRRVAAWLNIVEVVLENKNTQAQHIFGGSDGPSLKASAESAAMQAAIFLVRSFKIIVVDMNLDVRARHEHATQLFGCKRDWFAKMDQEIYSVPNYEIAETEGIDYNMYRVELDFLNLLKVVVEKYSIPLTPIDVMQLRSGIYVATTTISVLGSICMSRTFMGYQTQTIDAAKQTLAKEVLSCSALLYRFEVMDVNYHFLKVEAAILRAERNNYIRLKERVYGLKEEHEPSPNIVEQDQMTPKGKRARIPFPHEPPSLPKRDNSDGATPSEQIMIPDAIITLDLKFPEKRPRHD